jgi:hypothetical protein
VVTGWALNSTDLFVICGQPTAPPSSTNWIHIQLMLCHASMFLNALDRVSRNA